MVIFKAPFIEQWGGLRLVCLGILLMSQLILGPFLDFYK